MTNKTIITAIDGPLLEWGFHFTKWMLSCGHKLKKNFTSRDYSRGKKFLNGSYLSINGQWDIKQKFPEDAIYWNDNAENKVLTEALKVPIGKRFQSKVVSVDAINEFNNSSWSDTQPPMPDSQHWIRRLVDEGWTIVPATSQRKRLDELFPGCFSAFEIEEHEDTYEEFLDKWYDTNAWSVSGDLESINYALGIGLKPLLHTSFYNYKYSHPEVPRVHNWKDIYKAVT